MLVENYNIGDYIYLNLEYSSVGPYHNTYDKIVDIKDNIIKLGAFKYDIYVCRRTTTDSYKTIYDSYFFLAPDSYGDCILYNVDLVKISFSSYIKTKL